MNECVYNDNKWTQRTDDDIEFSKRDFVGMEFLLMNKGDKVHFRFFFEIFFWNEGVELKRFVEEIWRCFSGI